MVNYKCFRCGYETHIKTILIRHLSRKNNCELKLYDIDVKHFKNYIENGNNCNEYLDCINIDKTSANNCKSTHDIPIQYPKNTLKTNEKPSDSNKCEYCKKVLSSYKNLWRHLKTCSEKKKDDEVKQSMTELVSLLNKQLQDQNEQINEFKKELTEKDKNFKKELDRKDRHIDELIKKAGINNSNNTINVQNNIKLLSYSDTDRSHITDKDILKCLSHSNFCIPHLIEKIHFDVNKPENHNVYISNLKNKYVMMYDGDKWKCKDRDEQIDSLIDDNQGVIEYKLEEWIENGNKYPEMMRKFNRYIEKKDNNVVINKIKDEIKLILYNNRYKINKEIKEIN
tara:strand:- start:226 stop:1245 length:1020 start_codon:yes stop_codon:yes gene_type:complete